MKPRLATAADLKKLTHKRSKYGNVPVVVDGLRFHSKGEARRWQELELLQSQQLICELKRQVVYYLSAQIKICADFAYYERTTHGWCPVTEDFKGGPLTQVFKLKAKLFEAKYGRRILITRAKR